ncbi:MAG TPA: hypothetical protein VFT74_21520 [Isosphaeraceae bacterium]|nr:hypothetical protein [Isosphaeraceae bacterium]
MNALPLHWHHICCLILPRADLKPIASALFREKTMMRTFLSLGLIAGLTLTGSASVQAADDESKGDPVPENLLGVYQIVSGQDNGQTVAASDLEGIKVRITPGIIATADREGKEMYVVKYNLNTDTRPWKIAMTMSGGPHGERGTHADGILQIEKNGTVRLAYAVEGGTIPASFQTKAGARQNMFVLQKIEDENAR